jgi:hypothetical protein
MSITATNDAQAGAVFQSTMQGLGVDVSRLGQLAQLQLAVANALSGSLPEIISSMTLATAATGDAFYMTGSVSSPAGSLRYISPGASAANWKINAASGGGIALSVNGTNSLNVTASTLSLSSAGAAYSIAGTTTALTADVASGAITIKANIGTGSGAVGGFIFQVPVTHGSDSVAQTLTTALTMGTGGGARVQVSVGLGIAKAATTTSPLSISGLPTSSAGLVTGDVYSNAGILTIV